MKKIFFLTILISTICGIIFYTTTYATSSITTTIENGNIFDSYTSWNSASSAKTGDTTLAFLKMNITTNDENVDTYPSTLIDLNGDGLMDILHTNYGTYTERIISGGNSYSYTRKRYKYAIMINNGDFTFTPVYRCVIANETYYGDCVE